MKYRNIGHYLVGILMVLGALVSPAIPLVLLFLFLVYEVDEDWHLYDEAYHDILEALIAASITTGGLVIWSFISG